MSSDVVLDREPPLVRAVEEGKQEEPITARSVVAGFILALVMASINSYVTLKVGLIEEGTIITAALFVGVMLVLRQRVSSQETALVSCMGSAGGSFAFIANFFAAAVMIGQPLTTVQMVVLPVMTGIVGILFAVTLRELYVVREPLAWPTSKATITTIEALTTPVGRRQIKVLWIATGITALYVFFAEGLHWLPEEIYLPVSLWALSETARVGLACAPLIISAGYLIGLRAGIGFLVGALVLIAMAPYVPGNVPQRYIWPGVMFMVTSGLTGLFLNWRMMARALQSLFSAKNAVALDDRDVVMSPKAYLGCLGVASLGMIVTLAYWFDVPVILGIVMLVVGGVVLNTIATRASGETAFNPIRVMGVLLQGICAMFGAHTPGLILTGAGAAAGAIDQTGLMVQDNVFGRHFGLSARRQWIAQLVVIVPIAVVSAFVFQRMAAAYPMTLDSGALPAPIARMWAKMALLFSGKAPLDPFAVEAMWIGGVAGIVWALLDAVRVKRQQQAEERKESTLWRFFPHPMGVGIGLFVPVTYSVSFFVGALVFCGILPKYTRVSDKTLNTVAAAGIFGQGAMGLIVAILVSLGVFGK